MIYSAEKCSNETFQVKGSFLEASRKKKIDTKEALLSKGIPPLSNMTLLG